MRYRIIIADDHPLILKGLSDFLVEKGHKVLEAVTDGKTALKQILKHEPEIAILDIRMPELNGLEVAKMIKEQGLSTKIVLITFEKDGTLLNEAKRMNIHGYILKEFALVEIEKCLEVLQAGKSYFSESLKELISEDSIIDLSVLSVTEKKILRQIAQNKTTKEIGEAMFVSYRTVEKHRSNIIRKLGLDHQQNSLLIWAKENQKYFI
ncbi:MAG: response regulator transcription factor [Flavobacteriaceae bacterium]|nr:response regulator transcription factor [Bacteroidia bacterium]NNK88699.1 response regulator transcription factor [Flavobacteriaceae bacterium]